MSDKKQEKPTQLSFDDLRKAKPGWEHVIQPLDGGHVRIISTKRPSDPKKA
jgi:hypothetical protein